MSLWNGQKLIYLSYNFKLDVQLKANVSYCRHCTYFVLLESTLQISSKYEGEDDDNDETEEERISENSYFSISLQNPPLVTVEQLQVGGLYSEA